MENPFLNIGPQKDPQPVQDNPFSNIGPVNNSSFSTTTNGPTNILKKTDQADSFSTSGQQDLDGNTSWWDNLSYGFKLGILDSVRGGTQIAGGKQVLFSDQTLEEQQQELYARMRTENGVWTYVGYFGGAILDPITWLLPFAKAKNVLSMAKLGAVSGGVFGAVGYVDKDADFELLRTRSGQALVGAAGGTIVAPALYGITKAAGVAGRKLPLGVLNEGDASVKTMNDSALKRAFVTNRMGEELSTLKIRADKDITLSNPKILADAAIEEVQRKQGARVLRNVRNFANNYLLRPYETLSDNTLGKLKTSYTKNIGEPGMKFFTGEIGSTTLGGKLPAAVGGPETATGLAGGAIGYGSVEDDAPISEKFSRAFIGFAVGSLGLGGIKQLPATRTPFKKIPGLEKKPVDISMGELLARGILDDYGLPADIKKWKLASRGQANSLADQFVQATKLIEPLSTDEQRLVLNLLEGDSVTGYVPKKLKNVSRDFRAIIKKAGQQLVDGGLITPQTFQRNINTYLRRVYDDNKVLDKVGDELKPRGFHIEVNKIDYEKFYKKDKAFKIGESVDTNLVKEFERIRTTKEGLAEIGTKKYKKLLKDLTDKSKIKEHRGWEIFSIGEDAAQKLTPEQRKILTYSENKNNKSYGDAYKKIADNDSITIRWELTKQERISLGQIENASLSISETGRILGGELARSYYYNKIASSANSKDPKTKFAFRNPTRKEKEELNLIKIPETVIEKTGGKLRFGNLGGLHLPREIAENILETHRYATAKPGEFYGAYRKLNSLWKVSKTAFNPTVHVNNTVSNIVLYDLVDGNNLFNNLSVAHKALTAQGKGKKSELFTLASNYDLFSSDLVVNELKNISSLLKTNPYAGMTSKNDALTNATSVGSKIWNDVKDSKLGLKTFAEKATDLYRYEDHVFRLALFRDRLRKGYSVEDAAADAKKSFIDYDINAPFINAMRNTATPFLAYTYRVVPILGETAVLRPWKFAKWAAYGYALNTAGDYFGGGDQEAERAAMPERLKGRVFGMPLFPYKNVKVPGNIDGDPVYMNVERYVPGGDILDVGSFGGFARLPGVVLPLQPSFGILGDVIPPLFGYDLFNERKIKGTGADIQSDWALRGQKIWSNLVPNFPFFPGSYSTRRIEEARTAPESAFKPKQTELVAILKSVGVKINQTNLDKLSAGKALEFKRRIKGFREQLRLQATKLNKGTIDQEEYLKREENILEKMNKVSERYGQIFEKIGSADIREPKPITDQMKKLFN